MFRGIYSNVQLWTLCGYLVGIQACSDGSTEQQGLDWSALPSEVSPTPEQLSLRGDDVELGRALFFSPALSVNGTVSCASCHFEELHFQDGKSLSQGVAGDFTLRNSPSLLNIGWSRYVTWSNIAFFELERHMVVPLFGDAPPEMAARFDDDWLAERLASSKEVKAAIEQHPDYTAAADFKWTNVIELIAMYMRSLVSLDAPWDRYRGGDSQAMSPDAMAGEQLFFSDRLNCGSCHAPPFFSLAYQIGDLARPPISQVFVNTGLYHFAETESGYPELDPGLMEFTGQIEDGGRFRIPSLRNVANTQPYMHDGSVPDLDAVIDHYMAGGRQQTIHGERAATRHPNTDPRVQGFTLTSQERRQLLAFLHSLSSSPASKK